MSNPSGPRERERLSLAIICLDEAANIERCIRSVPFADEVVVLDSGSRDRTVEIAKGAGARVFIEQWRGFRDQKRRVTELCSHDWVLSLDADEALSSEAASAIQALLKGELSFAGYELPRLTWNLGRWIRHGGWYPDHQLRLYDRRRARWEGGENVHERVTAQSTGSIEAPILHWPFENRASQIETNNRYSSLGAAELKRAGKNFSVFKLCAKPISKFLETYVVKRGFMDGLPGFIIAVGAAYSVFLKFAKAWEAENLDEIIKMKAPTDLADPS